MSNNNIHSQLSSGAENWIMEHSFFGVFENVIARGDQISRDNKLFKMTDEECSEAINLKSAKHTQKTEARVNMKILDSWVEGLSSKAALQSKVCGGVKSADVEGNDDETAATLEIVAKVPENIMDVKQVGVIYRLNQESIGENPGLAGRVAEMHGASGSPSILSA
ncbi:unnamed protein product [Diplocarpon coronariae]